MHYFFCILIQHLDEVYVVLGTRELCQLVVSPLQVSDFMPQTLHVTLGCVKCCLLIAGDEFAHFLLHSFNGTKHVTK